MAVQAQSTGPIPNLTRKEMRDAASSNAKFRTFFEQGNYFAGVLEVDGTMIEANRICLESCGFTREEVIGRKFWDCGWWNRSPALMKTIEEATHRAAEGKTFHAKLDYFLSSGEMRLVDFTMAPARNDAGEVVFLIPTGIDITEMRRTEERLAERSRLADLRTDVSNALISGQTAQDTLQRCAVALVKQLDAAFARIWTLNEAEQVLELQASAGIYTHLNGPHGRVKVGEFKIGRIAKSAQPLLTNDVAHDPNISDPAWARREGMVAFAGYPMLLEERVFGVVAIFARHPLSPDVFGELDPIVANIAQWVKRKQTEEELRSAKAQLEGTLFASEVATWTWDIARDQVTADENLTRMFSVSAGDVEDGRIEKYLAAIHPEDQARVKTMVSQVLQSDRGQYEMDYRLCRPDGAVRWVVARGKVERDDEGQPTRLPGVVIDITERKQTEEALRNSEERFRMLADNMSQFAWMADATGAIFWYNQRWFDYTGTTMQEMQGWGWSTVHHPEHIERVTAKWTMHLQKGAGWEDTFPLRGKDGNYGWFLSRAFPIRDARGEIVRWFGTNTDITEVRTAQEALSAAKTELARQNQILDQTVQQRTAKLRETIQELEAFSYSISHDMRSPLRAMQGYAFALLEDYRDKLDPEAQHYLERIHRGASRLDLLIRDVLAYSKVAKGEIKLEPIDLNVLVEDIMQNYPDLHPSHLKVVTAKMPRVLAHEGLLTQIFANLLANAVKFARPEIFPEMKISAEPVGDDLKIWMEDNGIGISPQHHRQIFEIFGRVYPEKQYEGTGIGLAIVRKAAERMGGSSGVEAELGQGSRFWIILKRP